MQGEDHKRLEILISKFLPAAGPRPNMVQGRQDFRASNFGFMFLTEGILNVSESKSLGNSRADYFSVDQIETFPQGFVLCHRLFISLVSKLKHIGEGRIGKGIR